MRYRFCPTCGSSLSPRPIPPDNQERLACDNCEFVHYPTSRPCVGALVLHEGKVLLAQRGVEPDKGDWDVPGGFLDNGEHPLDGVVRELREETGLEVRPTELLGVYIDKYSDDEDTYTLTLHYLAEAIGGELRPKSDVAKLAWFDVEGIPNIKPFAYLQPVLMDLRKRLKKD
jgi:8-oxo-dGTP diphosphatase